ncbi:hypothetical protein [Burkholderia cepacia]|uniref:Phage-related protein n=1 Tax=Burkholderia cepacia TaxID=292 RepID=A0ABM6NX86_BURCE|nr:hypothetical protein [Burkholderia cepacia]AIO23827.1 hypothetical protein DM41_2857 [Burkholderia cepacia ATCC 25416]ALK18418.1 hypothetical protein APZ15_11710 [Burkholderia cepacia ATCC 25416]ASE96108.1 hypothetical protein CEQ23_22590 [Burkholderia cepacia]ATF78890.1 hypothetical protein CO711_16665 [Burkholderia cepacia]MCA8466987.1 hypothetical protein [Burkholderia cepacia]
MKERPILFSGPMVRAILEGRKTQTRRVVTVRGEQPPPWATFAAEGHSPTYTSWSKPTGLFYWCESDEAPTKELRRWPILPPLHAMAGDHYWTPCPHGKPGDRLWVRETWKPRTSHSCSLDTCDCSDVWVDYQAGGAGVYFAEREIDEEWTMPSAAVKGQWVPSIHMPRWASRITLEIIGVRVEHLQSISEADSIAEGIETFETDDPDMQEMWRDYSEDGMASGNPIGSFMTLWNGINAARGHGWDANPWVWAIEFRRIEP